MSKYSGALARSYGTALFETLVTSCKNKSDFEKCVEDVRLISSYCKKTIINNFLLPSLSREEKIQSSEYFLKNIFVDNSLSLEINSFLKVVLLNKRFREIKGILSFFLRKTDEYLGIARATVISARQIQEIEVKEFEFSLQKVLNKKIVFKTEIDESLISGFIVKLGHMNIDASFKARLNSLKSLL